MTSLETRIADMQDGGKEFWDFCSIVFGSGVGASVLQQLCSFAPPMSLPLGRTEAETYVLMGRQEVVNILLRRSQPKFTPEHIPEPVKTSE